jgi:LysR family hydrogen peroxide-inducible transcriptional activator
MNIQQLEYIVAVDRHRHFAKAAEACSVSQPTLSAMIQKLEEELDVKIFDRTKHPVEPTAIGSRIIAQARTTLRDMNRVREVVLSEVNALSGTLTLGVLPTIAPYLVPQFICNFAAAHPTVELRVSEMRSGALVAALMDSSLDMAVMTTPTGSGTDLLEIPLYQEPFVAYLSPTCGHRPTVLEADRMPEENLWVLQEGQCILRDQVFNFCESKMTNRIYEAGSIDTLIRIVDHNGGYTVIPQLHLDFLTPAQKENVRPITSPPARREVSLVVRHDYVKERMLNAVADAVKQIIPHDMLDPHLLKFPIKL